MAAKHDRLSDDELEHIYTRRIRPDALEGIPPSPQPTAVLVGGQPGVGKSWTAARIRAQLPMSGSPAVTVCGDDLREYHPYWRAHAHDDPQAAARTQADAGAWYVRLTRDAISHRANLVLETSMRDPAAVLALADQLRSADYQIGVTALATGKDESRLATLVRYDAARSAGDVPRFVPASYHDNAYSMLRATIDEIEKTRAVDRLELVARDGARIYVNQAEQGVWLRPAKALEYLDSTRERTPTARDLVNSAMRWETLVQRLANDPTIHRDVAAQTLAWRNEAVERAERDPDARQLLAWAREAESFRTMPRHRFEREFPHLGRAVRMLDLAISEAEKYPEEDGTRFIAVARQRISERIERGDVAASRPKDRSQDELTR